MRTGDIEVGCLRSRASETPSAEPVPPAPQSTPPAAPARPAELTAAEFRAVLDTTVDAIVLIDDGGLIHTFNRAAERMFGYPAAEVLGQNVSLLMPEPFRSAHDSYLRSYLQTGEARIIGIGREAVGRRKDGTTFPIELAVSEVHLGAPGGGGAPGAAGTPGRRRTFAGIVRDITGRKHLEKAVLEVSQREQRMVGRELHDGLCQELAGIAFLAQSIQHKLEAAGASGTADPLRAAREVAQVTGLLREAVRHAKDLSFGMFPVDPQPNGLEVALRRLADTTAEVFKVNCTFRAAKPVPVHDTSAATHLYRIAQDAVRDALRHGKAARICIGLARRRGGIELSICDDGIDPALDGRFRSDMTLPLMEHRARVIGAGLHVRPCRGGGARVVCQLPD